MVIQEKSPQQNTEEIEAKVFSVSPRRKEAASPFAWCILGDVYWFFLGKVAAEVSVG